MAGVSSIAPCAL